MNLVQYLVGQTWNRTDQVPAAIRERLVAELATMPDASKFQEGFRGATSVDEFDRWLLRLHEHCQALGIDVQA